MKKSVIILLDKYYAGETTTEDEALLKAMLSETGEHIPEKDIFACYASESELPEGFEESLLSAIEKKRRGKSLRSGIFGWSSVAAAVLSVAFLYSGYRQQKKTEKDFILMEQALSQVSNSLQPEKETPEMLVLWVDDNVEIIIN